MPQSPSLQRAELQVALLNAQDKQPLHHKHYRSFQPTAALLEDVDHIPAATSGAQRPGDHLAPSDSAVIANRTSRRENMPRSMQRRSRPIFRPSAVYLKTTFASWTGAPFAPTSKRPCSIGFPQNDQRVAGGRLLCGAMVNAAGDTFLIPMTARWGSPPPVSTQGIGSGAGKIEKQVLFVLTGQSSRMERTGVRKQRLWKWLRDIRIGTLHMIATTGFGKSKNPKRGITGLFTYHLCEVFGAKPIRNRNGEVTIAEVTAYINRKSTGRSAEYLQTGTATADPPTLRGSEKGLDTVLTKPTMTFPSDQP